jgi:hypothetical protein
MALLGLLLAALWLAGLALCLQLLSIHRKQSRSKSFKKSKPRRRPRRKLSRVLPLSQELTALLNGDRTTAERLISSTRRKHPHQSEQWCREKALYDLERDRR